jgi:hypothetical protein
MEPPRAGRKVDWTVAELAEPKAANWAGMSENYSAVPKDVQMAGAMDCSLAALMDATTAGKSELRPAGH